MANELKPWKYDIQYGPEGEANYAWVYDDRGDMIATMKAHKAKQVVDAMNTRPAAPVEGLESYEYGFPSMTKVERGGDWCDRSQAEAIIAVERAKVRHWQEQYTEMHSQFIDLAKSAEADNAALTARVKELEKANIKWMDLFAQSNNRADDLQDKLAAARKALEEIAHPKALTSLSKDKARAALEAKP